MTTFNYNQQNTVDYAVRWALKRNPQYYNFDDLGGDCTNFASQCLFAGAPQMNFSQYGWFFNSLSSRSPAWSGVDEFFSFLINNSSFGPFAELIDISQVKIGDFIQLKNYENEFYHTLVVTKIEFGNVFVCAHTFDTLNEPLESYYYYGLRVIRILGYRQ